MAERTIDEKIRYKRNPCAECDPSDTCLNCRYGFLMSVIADIPIDRIEAICSAEKDNRLVVLPCKVGDTVHVICKGRFINTGKFRVSDYDNIGKTVFLTREEAEAKEGEL